MAGEYVEFVNNSQPALNEDNLNLMQQRIKQDIQGAVSGDTLPVGAIMPFGSDIIPENWLLCNGQAVSRTDYQQLFNTIGTTFGQGDGFTTFNLPDLKGKVVIGKDGEDTDFNLIGKTGGEKEHTLTIEQMPKHQHQVNYDVRQDATGFANSNSLAFALGGTVKDAVINTNQKGGGQPFDIMNPYAVGNYIIKAKQSAGIVATVVDSLNSTSTTDALSANQGRILKGIILYESENGTTGNVTLNDSVTNYNCIEIFAHRTSKYFSQKILKPNNKEFTLLHANFVANNMYIYTQPNTISDTTITRGTSALSYFSEGNPAHVDIETDATTYIDKVIGYK